MAETYTIRPICRRDDPVVAAIIREVMPEFGCAGAGFAIHDPEVDRMSEAYPGGRARYYVVELGGEVAGGAGFGPLTGSSEQDQICELRKMYFRRTLRGLGAGRELLARLLAEMRECGFRQCYLETTKQMVAAQGLYRALGFAELPGPLGATGHFGCDRFFLRELEMPVDAGRNPQES